MECVFSWRYAHGQKRLHANEPRHLCPPAPRLKVTVGYFTTCHNNVHPNHLRVISTLLTGNYTSRENYLSHVKVRCVSVSLHRQAPIDPTCHSGLFVTRMNHQGSFVQFGALKFCRFTRTMCFVIWIYGLILRVAVILNG